MNKVAVLAGVSAGLTVLLADAVVKNNRLIKKLKVLDTERKYEHLRFKLTVEESNFAYRNLDQWKREEYEEMFRKNDAYLRVIGSALKADLPKG